MEMPIVSQVKPKNIDTKHFKTSDKSDNSFNQTLNKSLDENNDRSVKSPNKDFHKKGCQSKSNLDGDNKVIDEKDENGENENAVSVLQGLFGQMPVPPINLNVVKNISNIQDISNMQGVSAVPDVPDVANVIDGLDQFSQTANGFANMNQPAPNFEGQLNIDPGYTKFVSIGNDDQLKNLNDKPFHEFGNVTADSLKQGDIVLDRPNLERMPIDAKLEQSIQTTDSDNNMNVVKNPTLNQNTDEVKIESSIFQASARKIDNVNAKAQPNAVETNLVQDKAEVVKKINNLATDNKTKQDDQSTAQNDNSTETTAFNTLTATQHASKTDDFDLTAKVAVADQITDGIKENLKEGKTEVRIHLNPEELGGISVKIVSQNGALSVSITADNKLTSQLIASSMNQLTQNMQEQGINMSKAEVTYQGDTKADTSTSQQQSEAFLENEQNREEAREKGYQAPRWTVASETHGQTAVDVIAELNKSNE